MKKSVVALLLILVLFSSSVFALDVAITPVKDKFFPGEQVEFAVTIFNQDSAQRSYEIKTLSYDWVVISGGGIVKLNPLSSKEFIVALEPRVEKQVGRYYNIDLLVKKGSNDLYEKLVVVEFVNKSKVLDANVVNKEIDPRKPVSLNVNLKNLYSFDFGKLTFTAESDVFNLSRVVYAPADFDQNLNFDLVLDPKTLEGSHDIYFKAVDGKGVVYMTQTKTFNVMKYSDIQEVVEPRNGFLIYGDRITETNAGNEIATKTITREVSGFVKFFTSFVPELSSTERNANDKYSVSWVLALNPGEVKTVEYKTDYLTPLLILILVIAIIVILYVWVISPVSITKRVVTLHSRKGNIAIMKVLINIRNNRRLPLHNLSVMDKVPKTIRAPTEFGLERPSTTDVQEEGTRFVWHVPTLNPGQEKVYSYKIESNIKVLGKVRLPSAAVVIRRGMKKRVVKSSSVIIKEE